jgi:hypothetical protein
MLPRGRLLADIRQQKDLCLENASQEAPEIPGLLFKN